MLSRLRTPAALRLRCFALMEARGMSNVAAAAEDFPQPPIPAGIMGMLLGHVAQLGKTAELPRELDEFMRGGFDAVQGNSFMFRRVNEYCLVTRDLDVAREILGSKSASFTNGNAFRQSFGSVFPKSVIVVEGAEWKRIRSVMQKAMNMLDKQNIPRDTSDTCKAAIASLGPGTVDVEVIPHLSKVSFDSFHRTAFGVNFETVRNKNVEILEESMRVAEALAKRSTGLFPFMWKLPTKENRELEQGVTAVKHMVSQFLEGHKAEMKARVDAGDVLRTKDMCFLEAMLYASVADSKNYLTDEELLDNICTSVFGSFDTTSNTTAHTMISLAENQEIQERLYQAVKDVNFAEQTPDSMAKIGYLVNTVNEQNRIRPIASAIPRDAMEDVVLSNGKVIKKGTAVLLHGVGMGQLPEHWNNATDLDKFRPERWENFKPTKGSFIPFGFGGRQCVGKSIAMNNLLSIIGTYIQHYRIEKTETPIELRMAFGTSIRHTDKLRFVPRT